MLLKRGIITYAALTLCTAINADRNVIRELLPENFDQVLKSEKLAAVNFYAPWCAHCKNLAPEWEKVASRLDGLVIMASVNCEEDTNKPLCKQYDIKGYPTIKIFRSNRNKDGIPIKKSSEYNGPRNAQIMKDYLLSRLPSYVRLIKGDATKVNSKSSISLDDFLETGNSTLTKVILFTHKVSTMPLYKALSLDFRDERILMGEVRGSEKKVLDALGIKKTPSLLVITPGEDSKHLVYDGKLKYRPLYDYLSTLTLGSDKHNSSFKEEQTNLAPEHPVISNSISPNHEEL